MLSYAFTAYGFLKNAEPHPNPNKPSRSRSSKQKDSAQGVVAVSVELRTPTGTMMRISGNLTGRELKEIIIASSTHV